MILKVTQTELILLLQARKYKHLDVLYNVHNAWWWPVGRLKHVEVLNKKKVLC